MCVYYIACIVPSSTQGNQDPSEVKEHEMLLSFSADDTYHKIWLPFVRSLVRSRLFAPLYAHIFNEHYIFRAVTCVCHSI